MSAQTLSEKAKSLLARSHQGDHQAGLEFAQIVYDAVYEGDLDRAEDKKEAKDLNRHDALDCLNRGAEAGYLPSLIELADARFEGRSERKSFGKQIVEVKYAEAITSYSKLLDMGIDDNLKAKCYFRLGMSTRFLGQIASNTDWDAVLKFWEAGSALSGKWAEMAKSGIGEYLYKVARDYEKAIPYLEETRSSVPGSLGTLALAYADGNGVVADQKISRELFNAWEKMLGT